MVGHLPSNRLCRARPVRGCVGRRTTRQPRLGRAVSITIPILISVAALVVARLSYADQHRADVAAATASEEADASLVSFWASSDRGVVVQNLGTAPVYNVILVFGNLPKEKAHQCRQCGLLPIIDNGAPTNIGTFPPCSVGTIDTSNLITKRIDSAFTKITNSNNNAFAGFVLAILDALTHPSQFFPSSLVTKMLFTDPNGHNWVRSITGSLVEERSPPKTNQIFQTTNTQKAVGCA